MTSGRYQIQRLSTGSAPFDRILGGGFPAGSVNILFGEPGAGKTLFSLQVLFHLARQGKKGLYFSTLSEPSLKLVQYMQQFAFFDEHLLETQIVFADLGAFIRGNSPAEILAEITGRVEREEPALVVIDSFKALREVLGDAAGTRTFVYDLAVDTTCWGATTLLVGEYSPPDMATQPEFAIADGIVRFSNRRQGLTAVREVEILKLRGADYVTGSHFFEIGPEGLSFYPRVRSPDVAKTQDIDPGERVPTGVTGLDEMLAGGLPRGTSTVVQGATGTGKTLLGLHYLLEGVRLGEPGILFAFEETAEQLRGLAQGFGWDLRPLEEQGLLTLACTSPIELSTDEFLDRARREVERLSARRAVLDSLTSMAIAARNEHRFKELIYAVTRHFRAGGVTLNMNMALADTPGAGELPGHGISFAADNVVHLKYIELEGQLTRGLSVLKARGVRHATDVRRMTIGPGGIEVDGPVHTLGPLRDAAGREPSQLATGGRSRNHGL